MGWFTRLRQMKKASGLSTQSIAALSGIPEPTLEKIFSGATKEPKYSTMLQLVRCFGHTIDDLDDAPEIKTPATDNGSELDNDEQTLVDTYRDMTPKGQKVLRETAETLHGNFKKDDTVQNGKSVG